MSVTSSSAAVCAGQCVTLSAAASGGVDPVTFTWTPTIADGPGPHTVCPSETTTYVARGVDSQRGTPEFPKPKNEASGSVTVTVAETCADGAAPPPPEDGGAPGSTTELCKGEWPILEAFPGAGIVFHGWDWGRNQLAVDPEGNVVLAAALTARVDFGGGMLTASSPGLVVAKFDSSCKHVWSKVFTGFGARVDTGGVAFDEKANIVIAGSLAGTVVIGGGPLSSQPFGTSIFVAKLDPAGNFIWANNHAPSTTTPSYVHDVDVDTSGHILVAGIGAAEMDFGKGRLGAANGQLPFLARFEGTGANVWTRTLPTRNGYDAIAAMPDDGIALTGWTSGALDYGGGPVLSGDEPYSYLSKLDSSGAHVWSTKIRDTAVEVFWGSGVAADPQGNVAVISNRGVVPNDVRGGAMVLKFSSAGTKLWEDTSGQRLDYWAGSIGVDRHGNVLELGTFSGSVFSGAHALTADEEGDLFVAKRSPSGRMIWTHKLSGSLADHGHGIGADAKANVYVAGVHFGSGVSIFLSKLSP